MNKINLAEKLTRFDECWSPKIVARVNDYDIQVVKVPFEENARIEGRSPGAARQLASRARRRVRGMAPVPRDADLARQREVVDAFLTAARSGDFDPLVAVLDPDVVLRVDRGGDPRGCIEGHRVFHDNGDRDAADGTSKEGHCDLRRGWYGPARATSGGMEARRLVTSPTS
jgi:hypothetical protein